MYRKKRRDKGRGNREKKGEGEREKEREEEGEEVTGTERGGGGEGRSMVSKIGKSHHSVPSDIIFRLKDINRGRAVQNSENCLPPPPPT